MAFTNYEELQNAISDYTLGAAIPVEQCIALAEDKLRAAIKHRYQESTIRIAVAARSDGATLPKDFLEARSIKVNGANLKPVSVHDLDWEYGTPTGYCFIGNKLVLSPHPDASCIVNMVFVRDFPKLSDTNPTNWLLERFPSVYFHAALVEAFAWQKDLEAAGQHEASLANALSGVAVDHSRAVSNGNTIIMGENPAW